MKNYNTKSKLIIDLHKKGYDSDFILKNEFIFCIQQNELINPDDFDIIECYHLDASLGLRNNFIIYAISCNNVHLKGILIASYHTLELGMSIHLWSKFSVARLVNDSIQ